MLSVSHASCSLVVFAESFQTPLRSKLQHIYDTQWYHRNEPHPGVRDFHFSPYEKNVGIDGNGHHGANESVERYLRN